MQSISKVLTEDFMMRKHVRKSFMNSLDKKNEVETNFNLMKLFVKFSSVLNFDCVIKKDKRQLSTLFELNKNEFMDQQT